LALEEVILGAVSKRRNSSKPKGAAIIKPEIILAKARNRRNTSGQARAMQKRAVNKAVFACAPAT
jgi:hypothetical protein